MAICGTCEHKPARWNGECMTCATYRADHQGQQRPEHLIVAHGRRWHHTEEAIEADPTLLLTTKAGRARLRKALQARAS